MHSDTPHKNGHVYPGFQQEEEETSLDLTDELDHEILMHRDAHFGGDFQVMLNYYEGDNIGISPDFDLERIEYLAALEKEFGQDLAPLVLTGPEAERVGKARIAYSQFKELYELAGNNLDPSRLIADLVLSEEELPEAEIEAIVGEGEKMVPHLLRIIKADEPYDPLFPGYGFAPYLAAVCLGRLEDPRAVQPLFEMLGRDSVFEEDVVLDALENIGPPAKSFLLQILKSRPITRDNIHAAFALTAFALEPEVAIASFEQLKDPEVYQKPLLRTYLICNCDALQETPFRGEFAALASNTDLPFEMRSEIETIVHNWH